METYKSMCHPSFNYVLAWDWGNRLSLYPSPHAQLDAPFVREGKDLRRQHNKRITGSCKTRLALLVFISLTRVSRRYHVHVIPKAEVSNGAHQAHEQEGSRTGDDMDPIYLAPKPRMAALAVRSERALGEGRAARSPGQQRGRPGCIRRKNGRGSRAGCLSDW